MARNETATERQKAATGGNNRQGPATPHFTPRRRTPVLRWLVIGGAVAVGVWAVWHYLLGGSNVAPGAGPDMGGVPVEAVAAVQEPIAETLQVAGQILASRGTELRSEVTGKVAGFGFQDGQPVKAGKVLVLLDDSVQRAALAQAEANAGLAQANVGRYKRLVEVGAASQLQVDQAIAEGKLAAANVQLARANLAKMRIAAPFDGVAGIAQVNVGDLVQPGTLLVAVTDNDHLEITFKVPEGQATSLRAGTPVKVRGEAGGDVVDGEIAALDGRVDPQSRTLEAKVFLDNREGVLVSGQFVRVTVPVRGVSDAVVIPDSALVPAGNLNVLYVIVPGPNGATMSSRTTVDVGLRATGKIQVLSGLKPGQKVVVAGQQKLQAPMMPVTVMSATTITVAPAEEETLQGE